ncbi:MAG: sulfur carrier protein ThiS [Lachnospiraceae bacterium]|nr:sulfur carrier protein ThiS [Lachnospiraceae bacterium]
MFVNGKEMDLKEPVILIEFLENENYSKDRIAVEINEKIIPKSQYETYVIKQDDVIEVVSFVGGG